MDEGPGFLLSITRGAAPGAPAFQDSNYWPLTAPENPKPTAELTPADVAPQVTSLWLALDPVTEENGAMEVLPFTAQPESCRTLSKDFILDSGGSTDGHLDQRDFIFTTILKAW